MATKDAGFDRAVRNFAWMAVIVGGLIFFANNGDKHATTSGGTSEQPTDVPPVKLPPPAWYFSADRSAPVEPDAVMPKDMNGDKIKALDNLVDIVRANGYECRTVSGLVPPIIHESFTLHCDRWHHEYDIADKGGHMVVTAD